MKGKIQKWGNSLALRIPRHVAERAGLYEGAEVEVEGQGDSVLVKRPKPTLKELVAKITPESLHEETDWGTSVGKESW